MTYGEALYLKVLTFCKSIYLYICYTYSVSYGNLMMNNLGR